VFHHSSFSQTSFSPTVFKLDAVVSVISIRSSDSGEVTVHPHDNIFRHDRDFTDVIKILILSGVLD